MPKTSKNSSRFSSKSQRITEEQLPQEWLPDLDLLRRIIARTRKINDPQMDFFSSKSTLNNVEFKVATISTNLKVDQLSEMANQDSDYRVWMVKESERKQLRKSFLEYLEQAGKAGAKLVCFNELAYPTPLDSGERVFQGKIKTLVKKYNLSLIAGSYHDMVKCYNLSPVIAPSAKQKPQVYTHAKMTSAVKAFELIRIPPNRHLRYYQTEFGVFTVLICIDVYDPTLILRLMMKNHLFSTEEKIDFVFVPSFTPEGALGLAHACQDLSYAAATLVAYVNCAANQPRHAVYLAGQEVKESNAVVKCKFERISDNVEVLAINYDEYHRMRTKVNDAYSPVFEYLIGQKPGMRFDVKLNGKGSDS